jgi:hypothetical protein
MRASMPRVVQRVGKVVDVSRREVLIFICICSLGAFDGSVFCRCNYDAVKLLLLLLLLLNCSFLWEREVCLGLVVGS